jgi:hypothetical protein
MAGVFIYLPAVSGASAPGEKKSMGCSPQIWAGKCVSFSLKMGRNPIYFILKKLYSVVRISKGECHERYRDYPPPFHCSPGHPIWVVDAAGRMGTSQRIRLLSEMMPP